MVSLLPLLSRGADRFPRHPLRCSSHLRARCCARPPQDAEDYDPLEELEDEEDEEAWEDEEEAGEEADIGAGRERGNRRSGGAEGGRRRAGGGARGRRRAGDADREREVDMAVARALREASMGGAQLLGAAAGARQPPRQGAQRAGTATPSRGPPPGGASARTPLEQGQSGVCMYVCIWWRPCVGPHA